MYKYFFIINIFVNMGDDKKIPYLGDNDDSNIQNYLINDNTFYSGIGNFINNAPLPFSILITGYWGIGKTTMFNEIRKTLEKGSEWEFIKVNTWDISQKENYKESLLLDILNNIDGGGFIKKISGITSRRKKCSLGINIPIFKASIETDGISLYEKIRKLFLEYTNKNTKKVLLFIDDLDRIKPNQAIETVDLIKNFFLGNGNKNVLCITACDTEIIQLGLKDKYGETADNYYDKYFKKLFQFTIYPLTLNSEICTEYLKKFNIYSGIFTSKIYNDFINIMLEIASFNYRDLNRIITKHYVIRSFLDIKDIKGDSLTKIILKDTINNYKPINNGQIELNDIEEFTNHLKIEKSIENIIDTTLTYMNNLSISSNIEERFVPSFNIDSNLSLIVPVDEHSLDGVVNYGIYICPKNRKFKEIGYIAFYHKKQIVGYGKIKENNIIEKSQVTGRKTFRKQEEWLKKHKDIHGSFDGQYFLLEEFKKLNIKHNEKSAFTQKWRYVDIKKLIDKTTTTTDELKK